MLQHPASTGVTIVSVRASRWPIMLYMFVLVSTLFVETATFCPGGQLSRLSSVHNNPSHSVQSECGLYRYQEKRQLSPESHPTCYFMWLKQRQEVLLRSYGRRTRKTSLAADYRPPGSDDMDSPQPTTFREAEVMGLKKMQEGDYESALEAFQLGLKLPGSRPDVIRTPLMAKSPVGGGASGKESRFVQELDEFEMQAAHYNMACAHAQLGNNRQSLKALRTAFDSGFDNYNTVRDDPDLDAVKGDPEFEQLMSEYEPKGFNPFGFFGGGKK